MHTIPPEFSSFKPKHTLSKKPCPESMPQYEGSLTTSQCLIVRETSYEHMRGSYGVSGKVSIQRGIQSIWLQIYGCAARATCEFSDIVVSRTPPQKKLVILIAQESIECLCERASEDCAGRVPATSFRHQFSFVQLWLFQLLKIARHIPVVRTKAVW